MVVPTKLKLLRGNPGRRPLGPEPEPTAPYGVPPPPDYLSAPAADEWRRLTPELFRLGLLTVVDLHPLAAYCQAFGRWVTAERAVAALAADDKKFHGLAARNDEGHIIENPLVRTANAAARDMLKFAGQFGLTPAARARLNAGVTRPPKKFHGLIAK